MIKKSTLADIKRQIPAARAAARRDMQQPWWPVAARFDRDAQHIIIGLRGGAVVAIPASAVKELKNATPAQVEQVELMGDGLHWEEIDVDLSVPGLISSILGPSLFARESGRSGGRARSSAKAVAAQINGKKGGRPKKQSTAG